MKPGSGSVPNAPENRRQARWLGIDFHVGMTLLSRGWTILAGAATVLLVPLWLTPVEQGYYYTFAAVLGLQVFFELGLGQVLIQLVGHEVAHVTVQGHTLQGDPSRTGRLASLIRLLHRWYGVAALMFALSGGVAGALFFHSRGELGLAQWGGVWLILVAATALNLRYVPALALQEGCGQVGQVARLRLVQSACGYAMLWLVLLGGGGLWAAVSMPVLSALLTGFWVRRQGALYGWLRRHPCPAGQEVNWRRDVLPFQWRIAVSWASGYLIFQLFTPLIFVHQGAAQAGRFGMAMGIFSAVATIAMSWVSAAAPSFSMHLSRGEGPALNRLFVQVFKRSLAVAGTASLTVVVCAYGLSQLNPSLMERVASLPVLMCLGLMCILNCLVFSVATYMRAHKEEPMLAVSVTSGLVTALVAYFGSMQSPEAMSLGYLLINLLLVAPWSLHLFFRYFRRNV